MKINDQTETSTRQADIGKKEKKKERNKGRKKVNMKEVTKTKEEM